MEFIGCGSNQFENVEEFVLQDAKFKGEEDSGTALELIETTTHIVNSTFVSNRKGKVKTLHDKGTYLVGGAIIATHSKINISQSNFENNGAEAGGAIFAEQHSIITMSNTTFLGNQASAINPFLLGGAMYQINITITVINCHFYNNTASYGGVLYSRNSAITIVAGEFGNNTAMISGGVLFFDSSTITIAASEFDNNTAILGGVLYSTESTITIEASEFENNIITSTNGDGVLYSYRSTITIEASEFDSNYATRGGALYSRNSTIRIETSEFYNNTATRFGGVLFSTESTITIEISKFDNNTAAWIGGVLYSTTSTTTIEASEFDSNTATYRGGVLYSFNSTVTIGDSNFSNNNSSIGAVIHSRHQSTIRYHGSLLIANNSAVGYAIVYLLDSEYISANATFSNNLGSLVAFNSNITFMGYVMFVSNKEPVTTTTLANFQEGGAMTLFQSKLIFYGTCSFEHNHAKNGGAVLSIESQLFVNGNVTIAFNIATGNGGGVYLSNSELNCQQKSIFVLLNNTATHNGGGLHAISSSIKATSTVVTDYPSAYSGTIFIFTKNTAEKGGGLSLEANAKLYILKYAYVTIYDSLDITSIHFTANTANYGGAVYVDDDTNSGTCASNPKTECFFQVFAIYEIQLDVVKTQSMLFSQNHARISGSTLYGGLLDRCAVSPFAEVRYKNGQYLEAGGNGITYFKDISTSKNTSISSRPVWVCLCINNEHDCTQQNHIEVKKGATFTVPLVAVNQISNPVNGIIRASLNFTGSGLAEGQLTREIPGKCTDLIFNVVSPNNFEELTLYASDGPCKDVELSKRTLEIHFLPCSCLIGLQPSGKNETNCTCECHRNISQYAEPECDSHTGSFIRRESQSKAWISYVNDTKITGYLVYSNCPYDYCNSFSLPVNLNKPNGADAQCAFNHSSLLCGSCQPELSLSLGSSCCLSCPSYWPALLITITIAAILAGICLLYTSPSPRDATLSRMPSSA